MLELSSSSTPTLSFLPEGEGGEGGREDSEIDEISMAKSVLIVAVFAPTDRLST